MVSISLMTNDFKCFKCFSAVRDSSKVELGEGLKKMKGRAMP